MVLLIRQFLSKLHSISIILTEWSLVLRIMEIPSGQCEVRRDELTCERLYGYLYAISINILGGKTSISLSLHSLLLTLDLFSGHSVAYASPRRGSQAVPYHKQEMPQQRLPHKLVRTRLTLFPRQIRSDQNTKSALEEGTSDRFLARGQSLDVIRLFERSPNCCMSVYA